MTKDTSSVSSTELHSIQNDPSSINLAPNVQLTDLQLRHVGLVLDLFQAKGTMAKMEDGMTEDAVYEDMFATCKNRKEVAGQFLGLPIVTSSSRTLSHTVTSCTPSTSSPTTSEIHVKVHHLFTFKPASTDFNMNSTLIIFSDEQSGKITRLQDRPMDNIKGKEGGLIHMLRKLNAVAGPTAIGGLPKDGKQDAEKVIKHQR